MSRKYPQSISELSDEPFLAILKSKSIYIPGDERSRTNPGHGYPESTEHSFDIEVYDSEEGWKKEVERLTTRKEKFKAVQIRPASIKMTISVDIKV